MRHLSTALAALYAGLIYLFIFLPVVVLVLFSFQDGTLPVPPLNGLTLRWYEAIFSDGKLMAALGNSLLVALISSAVACLLGSGPQQLLQRIGDGCRAGAAKLADLHNALLQEREHRAPRLALGSSVGLTAGTGANVNAQQAG